MAFRSSATGFTTSGSTFTPTPSGVQAGDYLGFWCQDDGDSTIADGTFPTGSADLLHAFITGENEGVGYKHKVATGSDSFTVTSVNSGLTSAINFALSGRATGGTPLAACTFRQVTVNNGLKSSPISVALTGGTAEQGDDLIFMTCGDPGHVGSESWSFGTGSCNLGTFTNQASVNDATDSVWANMQYLDNVEGGSTGSYALTLTQTVGSTQMNGYSGVAIAVKSSSPNLNIVSPRRGFNLGLHPLQRRFRGTPQAPTTNDANVVPIPDEFEAANRSRFGWSPSRRPVVRKSLRASATAPEIIVSVPSTFIFKKTLSSIGTKTGSRQGHNT